VARQKDIPGIASTQPELRFRTTWGPYRHIYSCPWCAWRTGFTQIDVHPGPHQWNAASGWKVKGKAEPELRRKAEAELHAGKWLFPLSFNCPSCHAPVAVLFDVREISHGHWIQTPVVVLEPLTWTTPAKSSVVPSKST
jgi:hypothetical protein